MLLAGLTANASESEVLGGHEGWLDRMGAGVREMGRGNTGTALIDATPAAYWNPALLPFQKKPTLGFGTEVRSLDRNGGYVSFQERLTGNLGIGIGVINRGDFNVPAYDGDENSIGTARPQAFGSYVGVGLRTSRQNAFGVTLQWYTSNLDVGGGVGNVNFVGGVNLGWYRRFADSLSVGVVIRNLGFNERLSADFSQTVLGDDNGIGGFEGSNEDFFPKTVVVAGEWRKTLFHFPWIFAAEIMDYQLKSSLFTPNPAFHTQAMRVGVECGIAEGTQLRLGSDRGDLSFGFGYAFPWHRRRPVQFDYALLLERGWTTFNPYAVGLKILF